MAKEDYAENLFQSIDTIVGERIKNLPYDHTIVATITDASNAYLGAYQVTTDNYTTFTAYSDVKTYNKNDRVYVRIVDTSYNRSKVITGKYIEQVKIMPVNISDIIEYTIQGSDNILQINKELAAQGYYLEITGQTGVDDYSPDESAEIQAVLNVKFYRLEVINDQFIAIPITTGYNYIYGVNDGTSLFTYDKILEGQYDMPQEEPLKDNSSIIINFKPVQQTAQPYVTVRCYITLTSGIIIRSNVFIIKSNTKLSKQYRLFDIHVDQDQFFVFNAKGNQINSDDLIKTTNITITYINVFDTEATFTNQDTINIRSSRGENTMFTYNPQIIPNNNSSITFQISLNTNVILNTSFLVETLTFIITKDNVNYILTKDFYFGYKQIDNTDSSVALKLYLNNNDILNYSKLNVDNLLTIDAKNFIINNLLTAQITDDNTISMNLGGKSLKADGTWKGTAASATMAEKLSTSAGDVNQPIYIDSDGAPTALTDTIGANTQPVYLADGIITPIEQISINSTQYDIVTAINKIIKALTKNVQLQNNHTLWQNTDN